MTTTAAAAPAPKKSKKGLIIFIAFLLTAWGIDNFHTHYYFGSEEIATDSTNVAAPIVDSISNVADTTKKDTVK